MHLFITFIILLLACSKIQCKDVQQINLGKFG